MHEVVYEVSQQLAHDTAWAEAGYGSHGTGRGASPCEWPQRVEDE